MTNINTPTDGDDEKKTRIQELTGEKKNEISEALFGDKEAILKDLKENHVKIEENVEMMGFKGKKVHIDLPAVGNFNGLKFDGFFSSKSDRVELSYFKEHKELDSYSYSIKEVCKILQAINDYMREFGVKIDGDMDYENDLKVLDDSGNLRKTYKNKCEAGNIFKNIVNLDDTFWLKDSEWTSPNPETKFGSKDFHRTDALGLDRIVQKNGWNLTSDYCFFNKSGHNHFSNYPLLLKC